MMYPYNGPYSYTTKIVRDWKSNAIGVYYCGYSMPNGKLAVLYIGRAVGDGGIRGRLLQHLAEDEWADATHFGYVICDTDLEAIRLEEKEISRLQPKYNIQLKTKINY